MYIFPCILNSLVHSGKPGVLMLTNANVVFMMDLKDGYFDFHQMYFNLKPYLEKKTRTAAVLQPSMNVAANVPSCPIS